MVGLSCSVEVSIASRFLGIHKLALGVRSFDAGRFQLLVAFTAFAGAPIHSRICHAIDRRRPSAEDLGPTSGR